MVGVFGAAALLTNIFQHKQEAKNPYLRLVEVNEETTDPAPWGMNWSAPVGRVPANGGDQPHPVRWLRGVARREDRARSLAEAACSPAMRSPSITAIAADTRTCWTIKSRPSGSRSAAQPGACLHCHAAVIPTYRRLGERGRHEGFRGARTDALRPGPRRGGEDRLLQPGRRRHRSNASNNGRGAPRRPASTATTPRPMTCG